MTDAKGSAITPKQLFGLMALVAAATFVWFFWPTERAAPSTGRPLASLPSVGDRARVRGCAGFDSEATQDEAQRAVSAGDKDRFTAIATTRGRHMDAGESVRVTGHGAAALRVRVEDAAGKGWWVDLECLEKSQ